MPRGKQASGSPSETPETLEAGDPEAQARQICLRLLTIAPKTRAQLATALRRRGVPAEAAETVLARFTDEQKLAATRGQPPEVRVRRAAGTLARKGYPPGLVFRLIKEALEQEGSGEPLELDPDQYLDPDQADD
jgi:regulatory protein